MSGIGVHDVKFTKNQYDVYKRKNIDIQNKASQMNQTNRTPGHCHKTKHVDYSFMLVALHLKEERSRGIIKSHL